MAETHSLSERTYHRLLKLGLSPRDVDILMQQIGRRAHGRLDGAACLEALKHAAQGGDPVALKLVSLPPGDSAVTEVALAYGALHASH